MSHEFAVTQGARSVKALAELLKFFGVGQILVNKRHDNHKEDLFRYVVRRRGDLLNVVIPFFRRYPMTAAKQGDFEKFAQCVAMIRRDEHKTREGLAVIAEIAQTMNRCKSRHDLIRILRDYTPDIPVVRDEDIVPSAWRHAGAGQWKPCSLSEAVARDAE